MSSEEDLLKKIKFLESELHRKNQDLKIYKKEISQINSHIKTLVGQHDDLLRQSLRIQKFLVPTELPNIQGFQFSTKFKPSSVSGGDYFDIFENFDKMHFGLFLSSASGYGMSALFLSVLMRLNMEESQRKSPKAIITEIFERMKSDGASPKDHSSLFYANFDRRKFQMIYCNVGQPLALHYHSNKDEIELLQGYPGAFFCDRDISDYEIKNQIVSLNPMDKLVFCSSGFLSLTNSQGQKWGLEQILSIIKKNVKKEVHELRNEIFYQASQFTKEQNRDLTVIVTEVKERIIRLTSVSD